MINYNRKAIAFDLDGTLLNSKKIISKKSIDVIKLLHEKGHKVIIATARPLRTIQKYITELNIPVSLILQNGACIQTENKQMIINYIDKNVFIEICNFVQENDNTCSISIMNNDLWYTLNDFDYLKYYNVNIGPQKINKSEFITLDCTKILVNNCNIYNTMKNRYKNIVNLVLTDNESLIQIMNINSSKENALKNVLSDLNISEKDLICFGDDHNDIGMFNLSGASVAMGNSILELKKISKYVTDTNDQDGISNFFNSDEWLKFEKT